MGACCVGNPPCGWRRQRPTIIATGPRKSRTPRRCSGRRPMPMGAGGLPAGRVCVRAPRRLRRPGGLWPRTGRRADPPAVVRWRRGRARRGRATDVQQCSIRLRAMVPMRRCPGFRHGGGQCRRGLGVALPLFLSRKPQAVRSWRAASTASVCSPGWGNGLRTPGRRPPISSGSSTVGPTEPSSICIGTRPPLAFRCGSSSN